ncbi:MAG: exodeoxyribonuclease VII large subunit [Firmicutes bacterium]|nr:exodeoxyribonuclease VII large subunit [Bacillota bacterium]
MQDKYITVGQLTRYIKFKIDNDEHLSRVFLKGEISNFKAHTRGHFYFTIKDETSRINAVMFSSSAAKLKFMPTDGMKILVVGRVSVYESTGGYQIYVEEMIEDGVGNLYVQFEQLKKKLAAEGLFAPEHKRPIPKIPKRVGIVTASTGAAIRDILSTIQRRWPFTETILFPSLVQGASAAPDIVRQIERAQEFDLDVLIVGRGGGSIEDMWCFNDEMVARTIYNSRIPIISAVGHEIDFTIADFVADLRAPTPTGAAEMAVPSKQDMIQYLNQLVLRLNKGISHEVSVKKDKLLTLKNSRVLQNPVTLYEMKEQKFDSIFEKLQLVMQGIISKERTNFTALLQRTSYGIEKTLISEKHRFERNLNKLDVLNPLLTISRGYSVVRKDNKVISSISLVKEKDKIELELKDGFIETEVLTIKKEK